MPPKDIEWQRYNTELPDKGPFYTETDFSNLIVEPWNAISSLLFLIPALYWAFKVRNSLKEYWFLALCVPLLILGGLGSTFFHAFRSSRLLLYMDVLPILVLTIAVSAYFWHKVFNHWLITVVIMVFVYFLRNLVFELDYFSKHTAINVSYAIGGVAIFLPILIVLIRTSFRKVKVAVISVLLFILALFFREIDARTLNLLPMGTHFLWHATSATAAFFLAEYLYFVKGIKPGLAKREFSQNTLPLTSSKNSQTS